MTRLQKVVYSMFGLIAAVTALVGFFSESVFLMAIAIFILVLGVYAKEF